MNTDLNAAIAAHLNGAGYSDGAIAAGIAYADEQGYSSDDEALSLTVSHILYDADELANGARFGVEGGWQQA